jgi:hypothetical protein
MAFEGYVAVKGNKQGQFHGESTDPKQSKLIPVVAFQNQVSLSTTYQKIEITDTIAKTSAVDDW